MSGPFCWLTSPGANVRVHRFGKRGACAPASAAGSLRGLARTFQFEPGKSLKPIVQIVAKNQGPSARFPCAQLAPPDRPIEGRLTDASGGYRLPDCEGQGIGHRNISPWVSVGGSWCATAKSLDPARARWHLANSAMRALRALRYLLRRPAARRTVSSDGVSAPSLRPTALNSSMSVVPLGTPPEYSSSIARFARSRFAELLWRRGAT